MWQVRKRGGVTIVQQPADAEFPFMPQSALDNVAIEFVLPVERIAQKVIQLTGRELSGSESHRTSALIVEDERLAAENLRERLDELGYDVCGVVTTGESAIQTAQADYPDVVLMDIDLAGELTGIEAARTIWERLQIPIVYVTAFGDRETLKAVSATESYGYIVKPFHTAAIDAVIQLALDRRKKENRR
jgi:CheY-like chemotaxis protein